MIRLLIALLLAPALHATVNEAILLEAIAMVETGNRANVVGRAHERGAWQLTPTVRARVGGHDYEAALKWLRIVKTDMARHGIYVNPTNVALCWNAGIYATRKGRAPMSSYLYANRVDNLYQAILRERRK